ncbi:hypothetical protein F5Y11DRAFT_170151 [Daldinia sp. FL1419]|nr:hypothetical protein F5Y11DRAFT_170151 [Daldinia sp. FL1419]
MMPTSWLVYAIIFCLVYRSLILTPLKGQDGVRLVEGGPEALSHRYRHRTTGQRPGRHRIRHGTKGGQQRSSRLSALGPPKPESNCCGVAGGSFNLRGGTRVPRIHDVYENCRMDVNSLPAITME